MSGKRALLSIVILSIPATLLLQGNEAHALPHQADTADMSATSPAATQLASDTCAVAATIDPQAVASQAQQGAASIPVAQVGLSPNVCARALNSLALASRSSIADVDAGIDKATGEKKEPADGSPGDDCKTHLEVPTLTYGAELAHGQWTSKMFADADGLVHRVTQSGAQQEIGAYRIEQTVPVTDSAPNGARIVNGDHIYDFTAVTTQIRCKTAADGAKDCPEGMSDGANMSILRVYQETDTGRNLSALYVIPAAVSKTFSFKLGQDGKDGEVEASIQEGAGGLTQIKTYNPDTGKVAMSSFGASLSTTDAKLKWNKDVKGFELSIGPEVFNNVSYVSGGMTTETDVAFGAEIKRGPFTLGVEFAHRTRITDVPETAGENPVTFTAAIDDPAAFGKDIKKGLSALKSKLSGGSKPAATAPAAPQPAAPQPANP